MKGQEVETPSGRIALVTGAGRGIGRSIALRFAAAGMRVAALARTEKELTETASGAPERILPIVADVSRSDDIDRALAMTRDKLGTIDILVNNAAVFLHKKIMETTSEEWTRLFEVNALGPFLLTRAALPEMLRRNSGRIINVCSTASHRGYASQSAYVASKHALLGFTKVLAEELRGTGVRVHALSPGGVNTALVQVRKDINPNDYMSPDEIADMALFLANLTGAAMVDELVVRREQAEPFR